MGARERDTKSLQDKLKELFNAKKSGARGELELSAWCAELGPPAPTARRIRAARELTDKLATHRLPFGGPERVWTLVRDLVEESSGAGSAGQAAALQLLGAVRAPPPLRVALLRYLHQQLTAPHAAAAAAPRLRLVCALLANGRDLTGAEELVGPLLADWLGCAPPPLLPDLLRTATAVVKYNASALTEHQLHALVNATCVVMTCAEGEAAVSGALSLLEAVVAYAVLPRGALAPLVRALCVTANLEAWAGACWRLMRLVAGADLGHAALGEALRLASAATDPSPEAAGVARGAVFLVHMALWGAQRAPQLRVSPLAVLPALRRAAEARAPAVTYEVVLAIQALLALSARELDAPAWSALLAAVHAALRHEQSLQPVVEPLRAKVHALLAALEQLHTGGHYCGELDELLDLLDEASPHRPEASVMWVITARCEILCCASGATRALALGERYVRQETRLVVRLHALSQLVAYSLRHHALLGDELLERVALPLLTSCSLDPAPAVRAAAAQHVTTLAHHAAPPALTDLIDLLEKILNRPLETTTGDVPLPADAEGGELRLAAAGLAALVQERLLRAPAAPAARALLVLLEHVEQHYRRPAVLLRLPEARVQALELVMALRCNAHQCVGLAEGGPRAHVVYSPLLAVEARAGAAAASGVALVPAGRVARALQLCLLRERDWGVLRLVLRALPALMGARALCVGRRPGELEALAAALCALCEERGGAGRGAPSASELHAAALPALCALAPLQSQLEGGAAARVVRCVLRHGLALRGGGAATALAALGVWALEARDTMLRLLPEVLLDLSKLSDTPPLAAPMLELASTLARLPRVFASLAEDQYMAVFAVVLPYTNPSRYNHYVVSLAHHVIAAWFLKCRLAYRRNFVRFITHGLRNYIIMPFEQQLQRSADANEDSSARQRSSSLGARPPRVAPSGDSAASAALHLELTECCLDLLARHASAPVHSVTQRTPAARALFDGGPSATWLVGHRLVTVTTTGCQQHALQAGPCERCRVRRAHLSDDDGERHDDSEVAAALRHFQSRLGAVAAGVSSGGADDELEGPPAACWGAQWAEIRVRAPTGDTAFTVRVQNRLGWECAGDAPLHELVALTAPPAVAPAPNAPTGPPATAATTVARLHKSSSEGGVSAEAAAAGAAARAPTQPINIPGSPQRQSSSSTTDDDDMLLPVPEGKARHPVRRSNSSPEMSSSWKLAAREDELLLLPHPEPESASQQLLHNKKAAKKSDTRVSYEAIPEEMSGTSPLAPPAAAVAKTDTPGLDKPQLMTQKSDAPPTHDKPHLMTHKSDPGAEPTTEPADRAQPRKPTVDELPPLARSKRSNTISVMSPTRRGGGGAPVRPQLTPAAPAASGGGTGGVTPAFVFLALYHNLSTHPLGPTLGAAEGGGQQRLHERPMLVAGTSHQRSLKNLELTPPVDTVRVGVLYLGPHQVQDEVAALRNPYGSRRYLEFVRALGVRVPLPAPFVALEPGRDGTHCTLWRDGALHVLFHVATDMPNAANDPNANEKRKHIGNDYVSIVYNNSNEEFSIHTLKGQLNLCIVVVEPLEHMLCRVSLRSKDERVRTHFLPHAEPLVVTDGAAPLLARQLALHSALAAQISQSLALGGAVFASNALERLRLIKRLRRRLEGEQLAAASAPPTPYASAAQHRPPIHDFNDYT